MEINATVCDECKQPIDDDIKSRYIELPKGDLDLHGIWFGDIKEWLWFKNEKFCSWKCFVRFITAWHTSQKPPADDEMKG